MFAACTVMLMGQAGENETLVPVELQSLLGLPGLCTMAARSKAHGSLLAHWPPR